MSFDIPQLHFPGNSPEAQVIEAIINRDHVSPEEAVRRALRGIAKERGKVVSPATAEGKQPGELLLGLFADEPELIERIARNARAARDSEIVAGLEQNQIPS